MREANDSTAFSGVSTRRAVGYLRVFHGWDFPGAGGPLTSSWFILVIAYTMRRLPYTVRACYAALQQVSQQNGANTHQNAYDT